MRTVHWNKLAVLDYFENIDYLLREWSEKSAQEFIDERNIELLRFWNNYQDNKNLKL